MLRKKVIVSIMAMCLMLGTVACGMGNSSGYLYTKYIPNSMGHFSRGELYRGSKKIDNVYLDCISKIDDNTLIGVNWDGPTTPRYVATYDLKEKKLTKITEIEHTIEEQRVSANADLSAVYYGDKEKGIVRYDLETGEETTLEYLDKQVHMLSISSDNTKVSYVTYSDAYFSSWARTILNVWDLETGKKKVIYKSGRIESMSNSIDSIILE